MNLDTVTNKKEVILSDESLTACQNWGFPHFFPMAEKVFPLPFYDEWLFITVRNEVAKVMFLQACVCPHGGGVVSASVHAEIPHPTRSKPPESRHPRADTPRSRHPPGADTSPRSRHLPAEQTPPPPSLGADTPQSRHPPPERRPLLQTVRILLECILVLGKVFLLPFYDEWLFIL